MSTFDRQVRYKKWILELEERLALYLFNHPDNDQKFLSFTQPILPPGKRIIEVVELKSFPGWWGVKVNGLNKDCFYGADAQQKATKRAGEIANE